LIEALEKIGWLVIQLRLKFCFNKFLLSLQGIDSTTY
jgi:hypothetical protein